MRGCVLSGVLCDVEFGFYLIHHRDLSVHEKDLVLCLMRILARCVEVLRQFDFPLKGRSELFEPRRGEF